MNHVAVLYELGGAEIGNTYMQLTERIYVNSLAHPHTELWKKK